MYQKVKTFIVEDSPQTLAYLENLVLKNKWLQPAGSAKSVAEAITKLENSSPELVLMDIVLGDKNAFSILDRFRNRSFQVIFVTGHEEYVKKAFEYYAFYFLSKPFGEEKFDEVINTYLQKTENLFNYERFNHLKDYLNINGTKFLLHTGNDYFLIDLDEVSFCKSEGNYTEFYFLNGKKKLASHALKFYDKLFTKKGFFRTSRFHLVNLKNVKYIRKRETLVMQDGNKINVSVRSRDKLAILIENFNKHLSH